jgi:hypothetical protein
MKESVRIDPIEWLRNAPNPLASPEKHVLSGFDRTNPMVVTRFKGPHTFYRMAGFDETKGQMADPYGAWWVDQDVLTSMFSKINRFDMFQGWVPAEHLARMKSLPMHFRALAAICENWNDFREQVKLELPEGEAIVGLAGTVAPQPVRDTMSRTSRKTPWLPGGVEQVYFKQPPKDRRNDKQPGSINPFWVHWIKLF